MPPVPSASSSSTAQQHTFVQSRPLLRSYRQNSRCLSHPYPQVGVREVEGTMRPI
jgi:hypothetical protein